MKSKCLRRFGAAVLAGAVMMWLWTPAVTAEPSAETQNNAHWGQIQCGNTMGKYAVTGRDLDNPAVNGSIQSPEPIVIAVLDTGYTPHPDINPDSILPGKNFLNGDTITDNVTDNHGHGTFIIGQLVATPKNEKGIKGLVPEAKILPLKIFESNVSSSLYPMNSALQYAIAEKKLYDKTKGKQGTNICVINISSAINWDGPFLGHYVNEAIEAGMIIVSGAGNAGNTTASYPAQHGIGVGAVHGDGSFWFDSNKLSKENGAGWENKVWVTAPGADYYSTNHKQSYETKSGTSFAAPIVSALAAMCVSVQNDLTKVYPGRADITNNHEAFKQILKDTATPESDFSVDDEFFYSDAVNRPQGKRYGWGIVNFDKAIELVRSVKDTSDFADRGYITVALKDVDTGKYINPAKRDVTFDFVERSSQAKAGATAVANPESLLLKRNALYDCSIYLGNKKAAQFELTPLSLFRILTVYVKDPIYTASFSVTNREGAAVEASEYTVKLWSIDHQNKENIVNINEENQYPLRNGTYNYQVTLGEEIRSGTFEVDDSKNTYGNGEVPIAVSFGEQPSDVEDLPAEGEQSSEEQPSSWVKMEKNNMVFAVTPDNTRQIVIARYDGDTLLNAEVIEINDEGAAIPSYTAQSGTEYKVFALSAQYGLNEGVVQLSAKG